MLACVKRVGNKSPESDKLDLDGLSFQLTRDDRQVCVSEASRSAAPLWRELSRRTKAQTDKRNSIGLIKVYLHSKRRKTTVSRDTPKPLERKETVGTLMGAAMKQSRRPLSYRRIQSQTVLNPAPRRQRSGTLSWYPSRHTRKYLYLNLVTGYHNLSWSHILWLSQYTKTNETTLQTSQLSKMDNGQLSTISWLLYN